MIQKCKFCKEEIKYKKWQQFAAHVSNCKLNPNVIQSKIDFKIKKEKQKEEYYLNPKICLNCSNPVPFEKHKYSNYCSKTCGTQYSNKQKGLRTQETKDKIGKSISSKEYNLICFSCNEKYIGKCPIRKYCNKCIQNNTIYHNNSNKKNNYKNYDNYDNCKNCNKKIKKNSKSGLCKKCLQKDPVYRQNLSNSIKGKAGGIREKGGRIKEYFKINDSNNKEATLNREEFQLAKYFIDKNIKWIRSFVGFKYINLENQERKFYPDFYLPDYNLYVEYKGFLTKKDDHKMKDAQLKNKDLNLLIVFSEKFNKLGYGYDIKSLDNYFNSILKLVA